LAFLASESARPITLITPCRDTGLVWLLAQSWTLLGVIPCVLRADFVGQL